MRRRYLCIIAILIVAPLIVCAAQVMISASVGEDGPPTPPDTVVIFRGIAYPNSRVTIEREGVVQVEVPVDPAARFDITLGEQTPGTFTYTVYGSDEDGRVGNSMNFRITLAEGSTVTLTGIFLGPTIEIEETQYRIGDTITVFGRTAPESDVTLFVDVESDDTKMFATSSDEDGLWIRQFLATDVGIGSHSAQAKAETDLEEISDFSDSVSFSVSEQVTQCTGKNHADLNCDGKVNLTDFSILLFFWKQTNPANSRADINGDTIVNLTDLSILLFNWAP